MGIIRAPIYFFLGYIYLAFIDKYLTHEYVKQLPIIGSFINKKTLLVIRENDGMHMVIFMTLLAFIL